MRVFVAGASGAIGRRRFPQLIDAGHEVIGTHNSPSSADCCGRWARSRSSSTCSTACGARGRARERARRSSTRRPRWRREVQPQHGQGDGQDQRAANEGHGRLLAAAREAGVRRFVAQSVAAFSRYAREGGPVKTEDDPLDPTPPKNFHQSAAAMAYLEQAVTDFGGIALRYGAFYGAANDGTIEPVRKRQFPIVGDGGGIWSWIHLDDAAAATVLALEHDGPAIYNVVDDDPAAGARMAAGARPGPRREAAAALPHLARAAARR